MNVPSVQKHTMVLSAVCFGENFASTRKVLRVMQSINRGR